MHHEVLTRSLSRATDLEAYNGEAGNTGGGTVTVRTYADLLAYEAAIDQAICGMPLAVPEVSRFKDQGAHEPSPTHYIVLDVLFKHFRFGPRSHLLDVGCGTGRVLAYFLKQGFPGRVTGIELDPELADIAKRWSSRHPAVRVLQGNVLDIDLGKYTDFYLFNPFDPGILQQFISAVETQVPKPCTVVHMSDNDDTWWYTNREGWTEIASGKISSFRNERGCLVDLYEIPQHYTVWRFAGTMAGS